RTYLLDSLVIDKLAELRQSIEARRTQGPGAAADIVRTDRGKRLMDEIRRVNSQIRIEESSRLAELTRSIEVHGARTRIFSIGGDAILLVFLLIAGFSIASAAARREQLIDELRASEKRTSEVRDLMQTTLASIGDAVMATDTHGIVTFINPVAQGLTEYTRQQAIGRPVEE